MKPNKLKELLKHIILEVGSQTEITEKPIDHSHIDSGFHKISEKEAQHLCGGQLPKPGHEKLVQAPDWLHTSRGFAWVAQTKDLGQMIWSVRDAKNHSMEEMIANKDAIPEPMAAVNVEEGIFGDSDVKKKAKDLFGKVKKVTKISHPESNSEYFRITLSNPDAEHTIRKSKDGKLSLIKFNQVEESQDVENNELQVGDIVVWTTAMGEGPVKYQYVVVAVAPNNSLTSDRVDVVDMTDVKTPLQTKGVGMPTKYLKKIGNINDVKNEESSSGAAGAYSTPFAFKPARKKKKKVDELNESTQNLIGKKVDTKDGKGTIVGVNKNLILVDLEDGGTIQLDTDQLKSISPKKVKSRKQKHIPCPYCRAYGGGPCPYCRAYNENIKESSFLNKIRSKVNEKTNPDGTYSDDMEDGRRSNRVAGMSEMTTSSAAGGQPGGTIQVPAWGTKNKLGSPKGIKGSEKLGYKVIRSITDQKYD